MSTATVPMELAALHLLVQNFLRAIHTRGERDCKAQVLEEPAEQKKNECRKRFDSSCCVVCVCCDVPVQ